MSAEACLGFDDAHIDCESLEVPLHTKIISVVQHFRDVARQQGFDIGLVSGYRSFAHQLAIWNAKAAGQRPVLNNDEIEISREGMSNTDIMFAMLRWSALPGTSRHHWGTDFDIYDRAAVSKDYKVQLTIAETKDNGPFSAMYTWLDEYLKNHTDKLIRPYAVDVGGVSPEPWHLSYKPLAKMFARSVTQDSIASVIKNTDILFKKEVLENIDEIFSRFVQPGLVLDEET